MRLGLALSGGGLRATLFHLGVVKALQRRGCLADVKYITSVSGGSILAAHLVKNWSAYLDEQKFNHAAQEIIGFARMDVRGRIFRRLMLPQYYLLPYVENLRQSPRRLRRDGTVRNLLFERYLKKLFGDETVGEMVARNPDAPTLDILTTNLTRGSLAYFNGPTFVASDDEKSEPIPSRTTVARAVMTSALFPAVFPPVELNADNLLADLNLFPQGEHFTDGGVYDNLGIRRVEMVLRKPNCPIDKVLVCDASGVFERLVGPEALGYWKTALRSTDILMKRLAELEYEIARTATDRFLFVRISDMVEPAADEGLSYDVQRQIKNVRTDLDRFSTTEIDTLIQHGYSVATRKLDELCGPADAPPGAWRPFPNRKRPPESQTIRLLKRARFHSKNLIRWNDWASYVHPLLFVVVLILAWRWYDSGRFERFYDKLPPSQRDLTAKPDQPIVALKEVRTAIARTSTSAETRLHAAVLAYSLWLNNQAPRTVLDQALGALGDRQRADFEEMRWGHYFAGLDKKSTFGLPTISKTAVADAIGYVKDAIPHVSPDSRVDVAATSYGAFLALKDDPKATSLKTEALDLMSNAIADLDKPEIEMKLHELNRFRARLLKGHYLLESAQLKSSPKEAEELFRKAAETYESAGSVSVVGEYWKVESNQCNALDAAAESAQDYRRSRASAPPAELTAIDDAIRDTLDQALERCIKAQQLAPPTNWQPSFVIGAILVKKQQPKQAAASYLRGYAGAKKAGEGDLFIRYLTQDQGVLRSLCEDPQFNQTFIKICR